MRNVLVAAVLLFSANAWAKPSLDGRKFTIETSEKGKAKTEKDDLDFTKGKLHSVGCDQYGFNSANYQATDEGGAVKWEADTVSKKEGKIHWTGTVKGDAIEGTYVWTKTGQSPIEYQFKGTAKK